MSDDFTVLAIDPSRLDAMRERGADEHGNPWNPYPALGWEPLRCCLTIADEESPIVLISYQPLTGPSPWAEVGPVYVHAEHCAGYPTTDSLPSALSVGPRVLRTYRADGTLDYEHLRIVAEGDAIEPALRDLFAVDDVAFVHVRAVQAQCFTYAVTRSSA